jgi:hypothetical protein
MNNGRVVQISFRECSIILWNRYDGNEEELVNPSWHKQIFQT